jgi:type IV secretory pathway component VirB8
MRNVPYTECEAVLWQFLYSGESRMVKHFSSPEEATRYANGFYNKRDKVNAINFLRAKKASSAVRLITKATKIGSRIEIEAKTIHPDWRIRSKSLNWRTALRFTYNATPALT